MLRKGGKKEEREPKNQGHFSDKLPLHTVLFVAHHTRGEQHVDTTHSSLAMCATVNENTPHSMRIDCKQYEFFMSNDTPLNVVAERETIRSI
jgi:hypothetical protein